MTKTDAIATANERFSSDGIHRSVVYDYAPNLNPDLLGLDRENRYYVFRGVHHFELTGKVVFRTDQEMP